MYVHVPEVQILCQFTHTNIPHRQTVDNQVLCRSVKVAEVNGEMSESHEEENERSANIEEDEPVDQELPLEAEAAIQNGADKEMEADRDARVNNLVQF